MTDDFLGPDDGWNDDGGSRRRAAWGLTVLALAALVIVGVITIVVGTSPKHDRTTAEVASSSSQPASTPAGSAASSAAPPSPPTSAPPTSRASSTAAPGSKSCPTAAPCVIPGDDGGAIAAANALRRAKGLPDVPGSVTPNAQQCALDQGSGPTCVPHYAWQPLTSQDGRACVAGISPSWILDPSIKDLSVGWALINGQWQCAMLKSP